MSDNLIPLNEYAPGKAFIEQTFKAPFAVINAAIYHAVTIGMTQMGVLPRPESTTGATRYNLVFPTRDIAFLFVLQRSDTITTIRLHPVARHGEDATFLPETLPYIGSLFTDCIKEATNAIRYEHPDFTLRPIEGITPPMPRYDDEGWKNVFEWQAIYARAMLDDELAELQQVELQTVYNARSKFGAKKRFPQTKKTDDKPKRKASKNK